METNLHLHLAVNTMRDGNGKFVQGSPQFTTTSSKDFVKHIIDKGLEIPTVSCSRKEGSCVYPITELEAHNYHVPIFNDEDDMLGYCNRIITSVADSCRKVKVTLKMDDNTEKDGSVTLAQENIGINLAGFCMGCGQSESETKIIGANQEGQALCETCYTDYKESDNDLPW